MPLVAAMTAMLTIAMTGIAWGDAATNQSISINGGAASTSGLSVTVTVAVTHCPPGGDLKALVVAFRNSTGDAWTVVHAEGTDWPGSDPDGCTPGGTPTSPTTDFAWTLASGGSGNRTVYALFKHSINEVFAEDSIEYAAPPSDTTPPVITPTISGTLGNDSWYVGDVTVTWSVVDGESDITSTDGCDETIVDYDTTGVTLTCTATSGGGTSSESVTIQRDATAPTVVCGSADGSWHASDVSIACTATDGTSGLASSGDGSFNLSTNVPANTETDNASTGSRTVYDAAGNSAPAGPVSGNMVDKKAPVVSCPAADTIWHPIDQSVACTATDKGSGLADPTHDASFSLLTNVAPGTEPDDAVTGSRAVADNVGNSATAGPVGPFKIDKKAPVVACPSPAPIFTLHQTGAKVTGSAADGGSGPATQSVSADADTSSVGVHTVTLTALDNVGNPGSASCTYSVNYAFAGFFSPVDNLPVLNMAKAGQAIPLKWRITDAGGNPVTDLASVNVKVTVASLSCNAGTTVDVIEEYAAGSSGLQNLGNGYYQFNWKTPTSYANSCKTLRLDLGEGSDVSPVFHTALFQFKK